MAMNQRPQLFWIVDLLLLINLLFLLFPHPFLAFRDLICLLLTFLLQVLISTDF
jgi:hypothetical protein